MSLDNLFSRAVPIVLGWLLAALVLYAPAVALGHEAHLPLVVIARSTLAGLAVMLSEMLLDAPPLTRVSDTWPAWARHMARLLGLATALVFAFAPVSAAVPLGLVLGVVLLAVALASALEPSSPPEAIDVPLPSDDEETEEPDDAPTPVPVGPIRRTGALFLTPLLVLLAPALAHASPAAVPLLGVDTLVGAGAAVLAFLGEHVAGTLVVLLVGAVGARYASAISSATDWCKALVLAHVHNLVLQKFFTSATDIIASFVAAEAAAGVDAARAASADGKLPADVGRAALAAVLAKSKDSLGVLYTAMKALIGEVQVDNLLKAIVEEMVANRKKSTTTALANTTLDAQTKATVDAAAHLDAAKAAMELAGLHEQVPGDVAAKAAADAYATAANYTALAKTTTDDAVAELAR